MDGAPLLGEALWQPPQPHHEQVVSGIDAGSLASRPSIMCGGYDVGLCRRLSSSAAQYSTAYPL